MNKSNNRWSTGLRLVTMGNKKEKKKIGFIFIVKSTDT